LIEIYLFILTTYRLDEDLATIINIVGAIKSVMLTRPTVSRPRPRPGNTRPRPRPEVFKAKAKASQFKAKASHFKG